jgi:glycosyltransferase involved in cell wall biosynthesis
LRAEQRARCELVLYGPARHEPRYQADLESRAKAVGARLAGALDREDVARVLASTDLLVVPSLWFENAPLVIVEAIASKTPLLVSDAGGMAELVEPGVSGYHFKMGEEVELARELARAIDEPARLAALYQRPVALPTFAEHVDRVLDRYAAARALRAARGGTP